MIHLTNIDDPAEISQHDADLRALRLMGRFFLQDTTHSEFLLSPAPPPALLAAQQEIDIARFMVWRLVSKPGTTSDMLFLLSDALREMCAPEQFCERTTSSLRLLADLVAEEAASRPPAVTDVIAINQEKAPC